MKVLLFVILILFFIPGVGGCGIGGNDSGCDMCILSGCKYGQTRQGFVCLQRILPRHRTVRIFVSLDQCAG